MGCASIEIIELQHQVSSHYSKYTYSQHTRLYVVYFVLLHDHSIALYIQAEIVLNSEDQVTQIAELTGQLVLATQSQNQPLLPNDLQTSSEILSIVVGVLGANNMTNNVSFIIANDHDFTLKH